MDMKGFSGDWDVFDDHETEEERIESCHREVVHKAIKSNHPGVKEKLEELIVITELVHGHENSSNAKIDSKNTMASGLRRARARARVRGLIK